MSLFRRHRFAGLAASKHFKYRDSEYVMRGSHRVRRLSAREVAELQEHVSRCRKPGKPELCGHDDPSWCDDRCEALARAFRARFRG